jgi:trafficking protein particle complex subunit 1
VFNSFVSYRTAHYKLHYYETPTNLKFVMVTDTKTNNLRIVLHQIYVGLYVEYGKFELSTCIYKPKKKRS